MANLESSNKLQTTLDLTRSKKNSVESALLKDKKVGILQRTKTAVALAFQGVEEDEVHEQLVRDAEEYMKTKLPGQGLINVLNTPPAVFGQFGTGIELYFRFTRVMTFATTMLAVLYAPLLVFCMMGDSLKVSVDMTGMGLAWELLTSTMLPNLGTVEIIMDDQNGSIDDVFNLSVNYTYSTNDTNITVTSGELLFGKNLSYLREVHLFSKIPIQEVTSTCGILDAIAAMIVLLVAMWFEYHEVPRCVASHRDEFVTPQIYSIYVDCLPRRIFGGGGHEAYSKRLKQHFELLLEAQVTTKSATLKMKVVNADDTWCRRPSTGKTLRWCNSRYCPARFDGYDYRGRRTGHIVKLSGIYCIVHWDKTAEDEAFHMKCRMSNGEEDGDLLDATLLWRLEAVGLSPVPSGEKAPAHEHAVHMVSLQRDFDQSLEKMKAQAGAKDRALETKLRQASNKGRSKSVILRDFNKKNLDMDLDFNSDVKLDDRDVIGAFIIFSHTQYRDFIHSEYRFSRTPLRMCLASRRLQFSGQSLRVTDAVAPSDVFWNNLDFPEIKRFKRRIFVFICCAILIAGVILTVSIAKDRARLAENEAKADCSEGPVTHHYCLCMAAGYANLLRDEPPGIQDLCRDWLERKFMAGFWACIGSLVVCATTGVGGLVVGHLAFVLKPVSISEYNNDLLTMTTIVYVLCLGTVNVLVNADFNANFVVFGNGDYTDLTPKWYVAVGTAIMLTLCANSFWPIVSFMLNPAWFIYVRIMSKRKRLMIDLMELHTPPEFPFALRHAEQMSQVLVLLLFCSGMPALSLFIPISFSLFYWCDKWTFLRASQTPPRYSEKLCISQVQILQFAIWLHSSWSAWSYSNEDTVPSHCTVCQNHILGVQIDNEHGPAGFFSRLSARLFKVAALPSTVVSLLIVLTLLIRLLVFIVGHNMITYWEHHMPTWLARFFVGGDFDEFNEESSFANETESMKRRGVAVTYNLEEVKGYEFLQEDEAKVQAEKAAAWRMALTNIRSSQDRGKAAEVIKQAEAKKLKKDAQVPQTAEPVADIIGAPANTNGTKAVDLQAKRQEKKDEDSASNVMADRKARRQRKAKPKSAADESDGLVSVDALRLSTYSKGKGKGTRASKKKQANLGEVEASQIIDTDVTSRAPEKSFSEQDSALQPAVSNRLKPERKGAKPAKYLSDIDPFPKPDDLDKHLQSLHHEDLSLARQRLGIRRTVTAHEDLTSFARKFKMKGKGKGKKGEIPAWALSEPERILDEAAKAPSVQEALSVQEKSLDGASNTELIL